MLRYLGYVLVVVIAVALAAGAVLSLLGQAGDRISWTVRLRLTALDAVAAEAPARAAGLAIVDDPRTQQGVAVGWLMVRFEDGWAGAAWGDARGRAPCVRPGGLPPGRHRYEVSLPEEKPLLEVRSAGTVWVAAAKSPVVWIDASAVLPGRNGAAVSPEAASAVNLLAKRYQPVYLVAADLDAYVAARRRLAEGPVAPGPAVWVEPGAEQAALGGLQQTWQNVAAAALAAEALRQEAARRRITVLAVPALDPPPDAAEVERAWRGVGEQLAPRAEPAGSGGGN